MEDFPCPVGVGPDRCPSEQQRLDPVDEDDDDDAWIGADSDSSDLESPTGELFPGRPLFSVSSLTFDPCSLLTQGESLVMRESLSFNSLELDEDEVVLSTGGRPGEISFPMLLQVWANRASGLFLASSCRARKQVTDVSMI